jgi:hypothetical protein
MPPPDDAWAFEDPPNLAVLTTRKVRSGAFFVDYVTHDEDDGGWQFHSRQEGPVDSDDAMVVSLRSVITADPTLRELADLPLGWCAWRDAPGRPWRRAPSAGRPTG